MRPAGLAELDGRVAAAAAAAADALRLPTEQPTTSAPPTHLHLQGVH